MKEANGDSEDKEATKRKAEELSDSKEEPIPVSAEKIAKLKEAEEEKTEKKEKSATAEKA